MSDISTYMNTLGAQARAASRVMATATTASKNAALLAMVDAIESGCAVLEAANQQDLQAGRDKGLDAAMLDRLALTPSRIDGMIEGLRQVVQEDPHDLAEPERDDGEIVPPQPQRGRSERESHAG